MTDDAECLRKYAEERDEGAFAAFVRRNVDLVFAAAFRQTGGDRHLAEDVVQRVFVAAARKAPSLGRHPVVAAWLYRTTRFAAIDAVRSRQRRAEREQVAGQMTAATSLPEPAPAWSRVSPELDQLVAGLGESDRRAVILRFFEGQSYAQVGERLHVTEGAARMRVERALEKLRSRLARRGVSSSAAALGALLAEKGVMAAPATLAPAAVAAALAAPVAGGASALLGILHLMTSAKITLGVATLVTLASLAVAFREHRHADRAERDLSAAHALPRRESPLPARPAAPSSGPGASAPATAAGDPARRPSPFGALLDLLGNPALQKQNGIMAQMRLDGQYAALFRHLNLPAGQVDQLKALLVEKEMVGFDSMAAARQQGIEPDNDPQGFFRAVGEAEKTVDAQIATLLGPDGFSQFQQYQETVPARNTSLLLGQALSYTAAPLTDAQTEGVVQALTQFGTPPLAPTNPFAVLNGDLGVISLSAEGLAKIQGILSPSQASALQEKIQQQNQLFEVRKRMAR